MSAGWGGTTRSKRPRSGAPSPPSSRLIPFRRLPKINRNDKYRYCKRYISRQKRFWLPESYPRPLPIAKNRPGGTPSRRPREVHPPPQLPFSLIFLLQNSGQAPGSSAVVASATRDHDDLNSVRDWPRSRRRRAGLTSILGAPGRTLDTILHAVSLGHALPVCPSSRFPQPTPSA